MKKAAAETLMAAVRRVIHEFAMVSTTAMHLGAKARQDLLTTNETGMQNKDMEKPNPLHAN